MSVVRLNVGGKEFCTLKETLLRSEDSYFNGLLSSRFDVPMTDDGAFFIDRNGDAFAVILEYLRSEHLIVSDKVPLSLVRSEATFYSLFSVVEAIDTHKEKKGISDEEDLQQNKIPREDGFYINNRQGPDTRILQFRGNGKLNFLSGDSARNNIYLFNTVKKIPELWKEDTATVDAYARFYLQHFNRGSYQQEENFLYIKTHQQSARIPGIYRNGFLLFPKYFDESWDRDSFERYNFVQL